MKISEAKKLKDGDRVFWDGEGGEQASCEGTVSQTNYAGMVIRWDDDTAGHFLFDGDREIWDRLTRLPVAQDARG